MPSHNENDITFVGENHQLSSEPKKKVYSVTEISLFIKHYIENVFANVEIKGEVSGVKVASSGHVYFSLKDENSVINAICWRGIALKFPIALKDGMEIICKGSISTYPGRSNYQIIASNITLAGDGMLLAMLEERRKKFENEGLFHPNRKKPIPKISEKIGVITSISGAVIRDIIHRIQNRFPAELLIYDVLVQGQQAAEQISQAIYDFNNLPKSITPPDILIVARGGGSIEDLWPFNEEVVIRAVANSKIPIISAVGHETDNTLIDLASDLRAPTPTAAAELSTPNKVELYDKLQNIETNLYKALLLVLKFKLMNLNQNISRFASSILKPEKEIQKINNIKIRLDLGIKNLYLKKYQNFSRLKISDTNIRNIISSETKRLSEYTWRTKKLFQHFITGLDSKVDYHKKLIESYSYKNILKRGFAIIRNTKNAVISSKEAAEKESMVKVEMQDGIFKTKVLTAKKTDVKYDEKQQTLKIAKPID